MKSTASSCGRQPEKVDDAQFSQLIVNLLNLGYDKDNIVVFFGSGFYSPMNSALVATMKANNFDPTHLREAMTDFNRVLAQRAFPANVGNPPKFFFFVAADHGCNNAFQVEEKSGNGGGGAIEPGGRRCLGQ